METLTQLVQSPVVQILVRLVLAVVIWQAQSAAAQTATKTRHRQQVEPTTADVADAAKGVTGGQLCNIR